MSSKLAAARIASWSGVPTIIASAARAHVVRDAVAGADVGTRFLAHDRHLSARRLWVAFAAEVEGAVTVDEGARRAVVERGTSLLPAGVTGCDGEFDEGAVVDLVDPAGAVFARGIAAMSSVQIASNAGRRSGDLESTGSREVIHRDDLVVLVDS
jgi:glutamate 5-kinase